MLIVYTGTYLIVLFTLQLLWILNDRSSWGLLVIWLVIGSGLILLKEKCMYPGDHPFYKRRKRMIASWFVVLLLLIFSHLFLQWKVDDRTHSELMTIIQQASQHAQANQHANEHGPVDIEQDHVNIYLPHIQLEKSAYGEWSAIGTGIGRIVSAVETDGNRIRLTLQMHQFAGQPLSSPESIILTRYATQEDELIKYSQLQRGQWWSGKVLLSKPAQARNPGAFDYRTFLYRKGIHYTGSVQDTSWQMIEHKESIHTVFYRLLSLLDAQRQVWLDQAERLFSAEIYPLVQAMTMGYRETLQPDLLTVYQELGIVHLLAISGLHVGIMLGVLYACLSKLPITRETMYTCLFLFLPVYIYISGAQVSVVRSGLMAMIVLVALRFRLWQHSLLGLYIVYIVTLLYEPFWIYHAGYQLSFGVTFALLTVYPSVRKHFTRLPRALQTVFGVSLVSEIVSIPFIIFHFYQFSPFSIVLNTLLVPLYSLFYIPAAFILTLLSLLSSEAIALPVWLYDQSLILIHSGLNWLHALSWTTLYVGSPAWWWYVVYVLFMVGWIKWSDDQHQLINDHQHVRAHHEVRDHHHVNQHHHNDRNGRQEHSFKLAWLCLAALPALIAVQLLLPYVDKKAHIMMLDVGQAEVIVIELPYRAGVLLLDVGDEVSFNRPAWQLRSKSYAAGTNIILPYLRYRGIQHIDMVVLSHGHYDHMAGLEGLLGQVAIDAVLRSPIPAQSVYEQQLMEKIEMENIPIYLASRGDFWQSEQATFYVLHPDYPDDAEQEVQSSRHVHDYNLVLWNKIYETTFLWTGDVEQSGEQMILANELLLKNELSQHRMVARTGQDTASEHLFTLSSDVLKVAHHGSMTSTSAQWLDAVQPQVSLISAGRNNFYGHPHPQIMERLSTQGTHIYQTNVHGGIGIVVGPKYFTVQPTLQPTRESVK